MSLPEKQEQIQKLVKLFVENPFSPPQELFRFPKNIGLIDAYDGFESEKIFSNLDWKTVVEKPYSILGYFREGLKIPRDFCSIFSDEAMLYYLPLLLSAIITDSQEADVLIDSIEYSFRERKEMPLIEKLTDEQKRFYEEVFKPFEF